MAGDMREELISATETMLCAAALLEQSESIICRREGEALRAQALRLRQLAERADHSAGVGEKVSENVRTAFFKGAKWWEFKSTGGTMWQSDQKLAWEEACKKYPDSALAQPDEPTTGATKP
jgi:hypothetical protein